MDGWIGRAVVNKQSGNWMFNAAAGYSSPGFDVNDLGFMFRTDMVNASITGGYRWLEPNGILRNHTLNLVTFRTWDTSMQHDGGGFGAWYWGELANYWHFNAHMFYNPESNSPRLTRGGPNMLSSPQREFSFSLSTDYRKSIVVAGNIYASSSKAGSHTAIGGISVEVKPSSSLSFEIGPTTAGSRKMLNTTTL